MIPFAKALERKHWQSRSVDQADEFRDLVLPESIGLFALLFL